MDWKSPILPHLLSWPRPLLYDDLKNTLRFLSLQLKSPKFGVEKITKYKLNIMEEFKDEWKQLEVGEHENESQSMTIYCGGEVSAIDWAPSNSDYQFLAVACNSSDKSIKMNLAKTSRTCIQIYKFGNLRNDK